MPSKPNVSDIVSELQRNAGILADGKWEPRRDIPAAIAILRDVALIAAIAWAAFQGIVG